MENIAYGVESVVVAIGSRKDDDSKFHALAAPVTLRKYILTQRVHRGHEPPNCSASPLFSFTTRFFRDDFFSSGCGRQFAALLRCPANFVHLAAASNSQRIRRNIFRDSRARSDIRAISHPYWRNKSRITPDKSFVPNYGGVL